tara:strand:- start:2380 stop:3696 length:1317 start_codon:yes stop_codon:yes gene_type:complete
MATAKQIKSAIRSQSSAQRGVTQQLAGVESLLQQADFSSKMSDIKNKQRETMFSTAASGLELASTFGEGLKQKAELESNIKAFEESLPEAVRKAGGVTTIDNPNKASLMDVLKGEKGSLTSFLYDEKEQYMLGENILGSKYDVAAMGEKAKALKQTDLLDRFNQGEPLDSKSPTLQSSLQLDSEGKPTLGKSFKLMRSVKPDTEFLKDNIDKPLIKDKKIETDDIFTQSEGGPLVPELLEQSENSLSSFLPQLSNLNIIPEDKYDPNSDRLTEKDVPSFAFDKAGESTSSKVNQTSTKDFGTVSKRFSTPERALGEIDKNMKDISKLRDKSRYSNKTAYNNALERADKLEEKLKKNISSVYNSKTGKFRSEEYKQMFEKGKYLKGDPRGVGEKEGFANISRRVDFAGMQTPFQTAQEVNLTNVQNFINELFPKNLASR